MTAFSSTSIRNYVTWSQSTKSSLRDRPDCDSTHSHITGWVHVCVIYRLTGRNIFLRNRQSISEKNCVKLVVGVMLGGGGWGSPSDNWGG